MLSCVQASVTPWVNITGKGLYTLLVVDPDASKGNASAPAGEWCAPRMRLTVAKVHDAHENALRRHPPC